MKKRKSLERPNGLGATSEIYCDTLQACRAGKNQNTTFNTRNNAKHHFSRMVSIVSELRIPHEADSCALVLLFENNNKLVFRNTERDYLNYETK